MERPAGRGTGVRAELRRIFVQERRSLLVCIGLVLAWNVSSYMLPSYLPSYLSADLGLSSTTALMVVVAVLAVLMALVTFVGRLSDQIGRKPVLMAGCFLLAAGGVPAFLLIRTGALAWVFAGCLLVGLMLVCFEGAGPATLPALFPTEIRAGALSVAFNLGVSLFGGTTPLIVQALVHATGSLVVPGFYLAAAGVLGAVAVLFTPETAGRPLPGSAPTVTDRPGPSPP
jgi:MHS family proline/betaine transporter-like MFS transporter